MSHRAVIIRRGAPARGALVGLLALVMSAACARDGRREGPLVISNAGSLARPMRAALDTFAVREGVRIAQEHAGSLEAARRLTELGQVPDVIALADWEVFPMLLAPAHTSWYIRFARNRIVLAYTARSRGADEMNASSWWSVLLRDGVQTGRAQPDLDPAGYRTLLVWQLAEREYAEPGLAARLEDRARTRNVRPKSAELVGLLQAGELDYAWVYESVARAAGLRYLTLPASIDLGSPEHAERYALASVRIRGGTPADTLEVRGAPILYALSIPLRAPHPALAERFVAFLLSEEGKAIMRAEQLDVVDDPEVVGEGVPADVRALVRFPHGRSGSPPASIQSPVPVSATAPATVRNPAP